MLIKQLVGILEGKFKKESASEIFTRYKSLKKSNANPELLAKVLAQAEDMMTSEFKDKMRTMDTKYSGEDWWETVKTFYKVEERNHEWAVISDAKDWHEQKEWVYPTKYEADEQLLKLIGYKVADRKAGKGSEDKDFERAAVLAKRREPAMAEGVVTEGSWAMASTPEEITKLKNILSKPLRAKNAGRVLYNLIGDDSLLNQIDEVKSTDPDDDIKQMVLIWLKKNVPSLYKAVYHAKVTEAKEWRDMYDEKEEIARVLDFVKKKYNGKAWFKGGSYAYLIDVSKPKQLIASDGAVVKVKDILTGLEEYCDRHIVDDFINSEQSEWKDYFRPYKADRNNQADHETKNLMGEMLRLIPRGYLYEASKKNSLDEVMQGLVYVAKAAVNDSDMVMTQNDIINDMMDRLDEKGDCLELPKGHPANKATKAQAKAALKMYLDDTSLAESVAAPSFKGYDVSHEPDGVMVQVIGPGDLDDGKHGYHSYSGINVVFGKPGTTPDLVTDDKIADAEVKNYRKEIIAAAEKRLGKKEKDYLASL